MISGLDDVVVAETTLSDVDGNAGRLIIRGHLVEELADNATYEEVLALLWNEEPKDLGTARQKVFKHLKAADPQLSTLDAVRALIARLPDNDDLETALLLVAAPAVFTPAILRMQQGLEPVKPDPTLSHAADMLQMLRGTVPSPEHAATLDRYLVTASDHGLNASTFAAGW